MNSFTWGTSQKGQTRIILDGHEFQKKRDTKTTTHWRCSKWRSYKCPKTLITSGSNIISQSNEHSHELNTGRSEARQLVQQMKETVRSQLNPVNSQIIAASLQLVQDEKATQLSLPSRSALTRTLNRSKQTTSLPTIATDDRHFEIPDRFKQFCLFDSGKQDTERILIFGDLENLNALKLYNKTWLVDGTFKICPSQFYQLYTVHIQIGGFYPPCVYALLSNKRLSTYNKFLTALKSLIGDVTPERILIDFEIAALSAFTSHYETDIKGCYFHLCQSFMRKISELGLKKTYEPNSELVLALNMIPALSFVPESKVEIGFDLVIEEICSVATKLDISQNDLEKLDELTAYFQKTYIRGDLIGRKTLFPISLWNHYQNAVCGLARTTNAVEGWHLGVTALFQGSHPSIHTFLEKIQLDSYNQKFNILKASSGIINLSRKKYRDLNEKVQQITSSYTDSNLLSYIRSLAHLTY